MIRRFIPVILIGTFSIAGADQTYLDRFNPPQTSHTVQSEVRIISEIDEDKIGKDHESIECVFSGEYYVYTFSGPWDVGFAISRTPLIENEKCENEDGTLSAKLLSYIEPTSVKIVNEGMNSVRVKHEFDKEGTCPDGRVYYWENLYLYETENGYLQTAIYAVYGAC